MEQLLSAIAIVSDPTQNRELQGQAIEYLNTVRNSPQQSWQMALNLFVDSRPDGSHVHDPQIRAFALQILDDLLNLSSDPLDANTVATLRDAFHTYIRAEYALGSAEAKAPFIRNKFSHTLSLLLISSYPDQWPNFFTNFYELLQMVTAESSQSASSFNPQVSTLFLRTLSEISAEIADSLLKGAREFSEDRHRRDGAVRDHIRDRESKTISEAVLTIISDNEAHLVAIRNRAESGNAGAMEELIALARAQLTTSFHLAWININFTVTPDTLPLLFRLLSDPAQTIRVETANAFLRMVNKGLKEPQDKLHLLRVLSLREVLTTLEEQTRGQDDQHLFRESLGKVANGLGLELCKLIEDVSLPFTANLGPELQANAQQLLNDLLPIIVRFLADEWDAVSTTVHVLISTVLGGFKRAKKASPHTYMTPEKAQFLSSLLEVSLQKMKWDPEVSEEDLEDDDYRQEFDQMRKDLRTFLEHILNINDDLVNGYAQTLVMNTLQAYQSGNNISWQDVELAVFVVYLYGELQKGVKEVARELKAPLPNSKKPKVNYAEFPLTPHGDMLMALIQSNVFAHPHSLVVGQFFETVGRYGDFFKTRKECISPVLSAFIGTKGIHNEQENLRGRLFYLFHRFIRDIRQEIPQEFITTILSNIGDLLILNVELPEDDSPQDDILEAAVNTATLFDSQIYLFETVGTLLALMHNSPGEQVSLLQALTTPLLTSLQETLQVQMIGPQDVLPVLRVHHLIRALGNISKGFPDAPVPTPPGHPTPAWVPTFEGVADGILVSLTRMSEYKIVRDAARFAFSRIIASSGPVIARFIPPLMAATLPNMKSEELADFINFLGLIVHRLQFEIFDVLNQLIAPLYHHIANLLAQPMDGTDAKREILLTKRAYLEVLVSIMSGKLFIVFMSDHNKGLVDPICQLVLSCAVDTSDPGSQRVAWTLLARFTTHFGKTPAQFEATAADRAAKGLEAETYYSIPGYESFIYERLIPLAFDLPNQPGFNIKDGQTSLVLGEVGTLIVSTRKARGQESLDFFSNVFLPSKGWPQEAIGGFIEQLVQLDTANFKKYWTAFVKRQMGK
ncbi:ARM repeat-containing protein [Clavulina sp. PMI_390]|nr:ARM repeat-containing protein [Clavulina sp. PMI_390]